MMLSGRFSVDNETLPGTALITGREIKISIICTPELKEYYRPSHRALLSGGIATADSYGTDYKKSIFYKMNWWASWYRALSNR